MATPVIDLQSSPPLVLLANDQEWASRALESVLGPRGFATVRAFTGRQALELIRTTRADAIVLDAGLPDISGLDVIRILRDEPAFVAGTPIILLSSGASTRAQRLEAYRTGAWELLSEPYDIEALVLKLELFVRARREADRTLEGGLLDQATGLYNARGLARRAREIGAEAARRRASVACVALMAQIEGPEDPADISADLDGIVLGRLSDVCRQAARVSDVVGRLGRSELVVIAPFTGADGAERIIARIRSLVESVPVRIADHARSIRLNAGYAAVTDFSTSSSDVVTLLLRAASELRRSRGAVATSAERLAISAG
ncbi:MAG: response regulator [Cytophagaceae bacterium]|nr:response regulator [Gemmatimonadaceae bacterium]